MSSDAATKDEFIALASHQLRTPATAVKQYLGLLLEGYMGALSATQREFLQKAYDSNERQLNTINDLLQVAQIDAQKIALHYEKCDANALVAAIAHELRGVIETRGQSIALASYKRPLFMQCDPLRVRMAFENIIDNASKYSGEGTAITITVGAKKDHIVLAVRDEGVGIAKSDFPKLFQKFSRIDNSRSILVGGNGLGLYLAKRIIDVHNGSITVTSEPGKGTTFTILLPKYHKNV